MLITLHELGHNVMEALAPEDVVAVVAAAYQDEHMLAAQIAGADNLAYWFSPDEIFARAYAQFVIRKSPNSEALSELNQVLDSSFYWTQWSKSDWIAVENAMMQALKKKGWL
jgi:hypothetical protein